MKSVVNLRAFLILVLSLTLSASAQVNSKQPGPSDSRSPSGASEEDLSTASLSTSHLHPDRPELVEKSDGDGFVREFVNVQWRPGDNIYLYVVRPTQFAKPPVVIYLYGHPSETDRYQDDGWCKRVTAGGYAAVGFVPALTGHRYHNRPMKQWFVSELQESLAKSAHDVQMVLDYLGQRGDLDMNNVGIFGAGAGGTIAVMAASVDPRIKAIDLLDPWGDWPTWMAKSEVIPDEERPDYVKPEFLKKVADFDPVVLLAKLKTQRIRLIQINEDSDNTPEDAKKRIEASLPSSGENHRYESNAEFYGLVASGGRVFDWLKLQLQASESDDPGKRRGERRSEPMGSAPSAANSNAK
jgi:hypothetical protein